MMQTSDRTRYAIAAMTVKELHPKMMRKLACVHINAAKLYEMIESNTHGIRSYLNRTEMDVVSTLLQSGYDMFDESLMYKMISYFTIVQRPSNNWGTSPTGPHQTTLGDDIERLRKRRNALVHSPSPILSQRTFEEFFDELHEIALRFDRHLHQSTHINRFQDEVNIKKNQSPDQETKAKYIEALENVLDLKSKYSQNIYLIVS